MKIIIEIIFSFARRKKYWKIYRERGKKNHQIKKKYLYKRLKNWSSFQLCFVHFEGKMRINHTIITNWNKCLKLTHSQNWCCRGWKNVSRLNLYINCGHKANHPTKYQIMNEKKKHTHTHTYPYSIFSNIWEFIYLPIQQH